MGKLLEQASVVILAGGQSDIWEKYGSKNKALAKINGKPMFLYVVDACKDAGIEDITVIGKWPNFGSDYKMLSAQDSFIDNLKIGLESASCQTVLLATCDLPFLTGTAVRKFTTDYWNFAEADIGYSISLAGECQKKFPIMKRTVIRFKEGDFTGGNLVLVRRDEMLKHLDVVRKLYDYRKNPVRLAGIFGWRFVARLLLSKIRPETLSIQELEKRASEILGLKVRAIIADPVVGTDIDSPEQLEISKQALEVYP